MARDFLTIALLLFAATPVSAQGGTPSPPAPPTAEDTKAVAEAIEGLKKGQHEKTEADLVHFIKILGDKWAAADEKQRREIQDLAEKNLKISKSGDTKEATVEALTKMGGGEKDKDADVSTKILLEERNKKPTEENLAYFCKVCLAIGRLHHPKGAAELKKLLNYKENDIIASSAEGLGFFKESPMELKKEIADAVLKTYTGAASQAKDPRNTTAKTKYDKIGRALEGCLKSLTGKSDLTGPDAWLKWWNDAGKKAKAW